MYMDLNRAYIPKYFTQGLKSESFKTSQLGLLAGEWSRNDMLTPSELYFGLMKSASDTNYLMDKCHVKMS